MYSELGLVLSESHRGWIAGLLPFRMKASIPKYQLVNLMGLQIGSSNRVAPFSYPRSTDEVLVSIEREGRLKLWSA